METLKINFIFYSLVKTGGQIAPLNFAKRLSEMGHEISITTGHLENWFPLEGMTIHAFSGFSSRVTKLTGRHLVPRLKMNKLVNQLKFLNKLDQIMPESDVNVATFAPTAFLAFSRRDKSVPVHHMQHMETLFESDPQVQSFIRSTYYLPNQKIANSTWLRERIFDLTGEDVPMIHHAINHSIFFPRGKTIEKKDGVIDIVALGKGGFKGVYDIVKAVEKANNHLNGKRLLRLHLYGKTQPKNLIFDNKNLIFHQNLSDEELAQLYSNSDIQVTFSKSESFPLPPLEAMACGTSVITTPFGVEDYAVEGKNAIFVKPDDVNSLSEAIEKLSLDDDLRLKLSQQGPPSTKSFDFDLLTPKYELLIKKAIDNWTNSESKLKEEYSKYLLPI